MTIDPVTAAALERTRASIAERDPSMLPEFDRMSGATLAPRVGDPVPGAPTLMCAVRGCWPARGADSSSSGL